MTDVTEPITTDAMVEATGEPEAQFVGMVTRSVSWVVDALVINLAAIMAGLGAALVLSIFPLAKSAQPWLQAIAGVAYVVWAAAYFVAFWSTTGQTPGARIMQIRLVVPNRRRVNPVRSLVRWVGMNLAMLPLFAGYLPIAFGRRGFPDWLARTVVVDAPQASLAETRRASLRSARDGSGGLDRAGAQRARRPVAVLPEPVPSSPVAGDGRSESHDGSTRTSSPV